MWEDIKQEKLPYTMVEFSGEYDIDGVWIKTLVGKDKKLNYLINLKEKKYGIIQNPKILDDDEVGSMDYRLYLDDSVERKKIKLDGEHWVLEVELKDDKEHTQVDVKSSNTTGESPEVDVD